ncbi:MAG TPA: NifU family protein [Planctomycetes bacterium]|nr:NifU family protein [Planctomycetota bacterium]
MALDTEALKTALNELRPLLQRDGGDLEFISLDDGVLKLRLKGTCAGCPFSRMTLKKGIEARLKEHFPELVSVEEAV